MDRVPETPAEQRTLKAAVAVSWDQDALTAGAMAARTVRGVLAGRPADLACLFFSGGHIESADDLVEAVHHELAPRLLIGCSGEGVIGNDVELERVTAVALWTASLPNVALTPIRVSADLDQSSSSVTELPHRVEDCGEHCSFILLADPFSTPIEDALLLLSKQCPGAPAIGGLAGGGREPGSIRVVLNERVYDEGLVGVALSGPLTMRMLVSQGCRPVGERYMVTRAEHHVIHELSGKPALDRLKELVALLTEEEQRLAQYALHLGVAIDERRDRFERGDFLVRNLLGVDPQSGSVIIGDVVREGQTVQFHLRDARSASDDLHLVLAAERARHKQPPVGALLFSCCGRGQAMFGRPHHDVSVLREWVGEVPTAGVFTQGEIGPVAGSNYLHGYSASLALLYDPDA